MLDINEHGKSLSYMITGQPNWLERFQQEGALWQMHGPQDPHAQTSMSGNHVDAYFNSDFIVSHPEIVDGIVDTILVPALEAEGLEPDWVFTYTYGLFVAYACARAIGAQCGYTIPEKDHATNFKVRPGSDVLVVCDDIYSGGALTRTIERVRSLGANVLPMVFTLANLSGNENLGEQQIVAAADIPTNHYPSDGCPLCFNGSEALAPRQNWERLIANKT